MSDSYNFPGSISTLLNKHVTQCKNLALILDKYPPAYILGNNQGKSEWLIRLKPNDHIDATLTQSAYNRWFAMMSAVGATSFNAILDWRMVVGLGGESVLETDITLHHLYGIPFIPGSALKGLTRAYVAEEYKEYYVPEKQPEELRKASKKTDDDHSEIKRVFGTQKDAGTVIFFDAMPLNGAVQLTLDIMNSHYPNYYGEKKLPTNDQNPNPVTFLTVANTAFMFALAPRSPKDQKDVEQTKQWLQEALQKYGVGGKTSAGYGYFKIQEEREQASAGQPSVPKEYVRPPIPNFRVGQDITGSVVPATDDLRRRTPSDTKAFLRYQSFALKDVVIIVSTEEAQNWKPGETRICQFVREEEVEGCTVLVCQPRPSKKKKG